MARQSSGQSAGLATRWSRVRFPAAAASTGMGDRLRVGKPFQYPGQLSLLLLPGWERSTGQSAVMLCAGEQRQDGSFHMWIIAWDVKLCDPSLTCANLSTKSHTLKNAIQMSSSRFFFYIVGPCVSFQIWYTPLHGLTTTN